jgi:hypothetical protein
MRSFSIRTRTDNVSDPSSRLCFPKDLDAFNAGLIEDIGGGRHERRAA